MTPVCTDTSRNHKLFDERSTNDNRSTTHQSTRHESHAMSIVVEGRHLSPMSVERNRAVAAGNVKHTNGAVAVTNCKLCRVVAAGQWRNTLLISGKDGYLQCTIYQVFLQCLDTIGWVIWPAKTRPRYDL